MSAPYLIKTALVERLRDYSVTERPLRTEAADTIETLTNALKWYADPEIYKPSPHGLAFDDRDLSYRAISVLKASPISGEGGQ